MTTSTGTQRTRFGWAETPRMSVIDIVALLWAERALVLAVGGAILALGLVAAFLAPKSYTAHAELLVRLGEEYIYQPTTGATGAGAGSAPDMQAIVNAEMRLIGSGDVVRGAIQSVGLERLYPEIAHTPGAMAQRMAAAEQTFSRNLTIETAPQTPSIALSFQNKSPELAAAALNALTDQYMARRRDVLMGGEYAALSNESADLDARAGAANQALTAFLSEHQLSDFDAESSALSARAADIETQLFDADAKRREADASASSFRAQFQALPAQIDLYTESDARRDLVQAQMQREQMLSQYQEDALPVREIDRRIAQLQQFLAGGDPASVIRRGPNPVRQEVSTQMYAAQAEARAQQGRETALTQQRTDVRARLQAMRVLEPQFRQLARERTILETSAQNFASRAEEARARSQMLGHATDTISPVERATAPSQGKSLRWPILLATVLIATIVAVTAGLSRALLRRAFPTPTSAARTLNVPVLAIMPYAGAAKPGKAARPLGGKPSLSLVEGGA